MTHGRAVSKLSGLEVFVVIGVRGIKIIVAMPTSNVELVRVVERLIML